MVFLLIAIFAFLGTATGESRDLKVIQASEIISKVEKGEPVDYSYVLVKGNLDLSGLNLFKVRHIYIPIKITDSKITGSIYLNDTILHGMVNFKRTEFMGPAVFAGTLFDEGADFDNSRFDAYASFMDSKFNRYAHFSYARFDGSANFLGARFNGEFDFHNSRSNGPASFRSVVFEDNANFEVTTFIESASFEETRFSNANYLGAQFKGPVDFDFAQFNKSADFTGTIFSKELYFYGVKFARLLIIWDSLKNKLVCDGPTYLLLVRNFKDMEQFEDADDCYYQYRDLKRQERPLDWSKLFDYISWLSCGYGVRWQHTILSGILVTILFGIYYEFSGSKNIMENLFIKIDLKNSNYDPIQNLRRSISFSAMTLLSLPSEWFPFGKEEYTKSIKHHLWCAILERLIGWSLMLLLIGTLSRLMVRY